MVMTDATGKRAFHETNHLERIRIDLLCGGHGARKGSPGPDSPIVPR